jgi:hypothetical protein
MAEGGSRLEQVTPFMQHRNASTKEETLTTNKEPITTEALRSATASIQRVLDGSTCLEDWASAFSQVFNLSGRAVNSKAAPGTAMASARREYDETLRKWYQHLPRAAGLADRREKPVRVTTYSWNRAESLAGLARPDALVDTALCSRGFCSPPPATHPVKVKLFFRC